MSEQEQLKRRIPWHRTRIDRRLLADLNRRSDLLGFAQTLGYLATLTATGAFAWWVSIHFAWYWFAAAVFLHGTCCAFSVNGFHELCHNSVFRTRSLNVFFLHLLSFIGWHNPVLFWASHSEHHKYTPLPPGGRRGGAAGRDDPEGVPCAAPSSTTGASTRRSG